MIISEASTERPKATSLMANLLSLGKTSDSTSDLVASRFASISDALGARLPSRGYIRH